MNKNDTMPLHEQLMLLMLRDDTGAMESHTDMHQLALGGAILAELILAGAIAIDDDKKKHVRRVRDTTLHDEILSECLQLPPGILVDFGADLDGWHMRLPSRFLDKS